VVTTTQVYDFTTNTWSQVAADPYQVCGTDVALNGKLYQIGGLDSSTLAVTAAVSVYDPSTNTWSKAPAYPAAVYLQSCGAISGTVYCAGGFGNGATSAATSAAYRYTPGDATWSAISSLPMPLEGSAFSVADGELLLSGGEPAYPDFTTAGYKYNPVMNWWTPLPPAPAAEFGAAAAPGFYTFGGLSSSGIIGATADVLSGYDQAGPVSLPWLSLSQTSGTIKPGGKITIQIRLNAAKAGLSPGGTVTAALGFESATPYAVTPVTVSLTAR
jgi:N-acetylneuraminic acid mutarotase